MFSEYDSDWAEEDFQQDMQQCDLEAQVCAGFYTTDTSWLHWLPWNREEGRLSD